MTYTQLAYAHLLTVIPAFLIGTYLIVRRKGTRTHRQLGKIYLLLMFVTGLTTLFMPSRVGATLLGHFGFIHLFSLLTLVAVPTAYYAARNHKVSLHKHNMVGLYFGGILIAGAFAFTPGRMLHAFLWGP